MALLDAATARLIHDHLIWMQATGLAAHTRSRRSPTPPPLAERTGEMSQIPEEMSAEIAALIRGWAEQSPLSAQLLIDAFSRGVQIGREAAARDIEAAVLKHMLPSPYGYSTVDIQALTADIARDVLGTDPATAIS